MKTEGPRLAWFFRLSFLLILTTKPLVLSAGSLEVVIGPPSLGQGGSNPVSIPPINIIDWQVAYVTDANREMIFSLVPGLFYGQRWYLDQFYAALDAGILVTTSGVGLGVAEALGYHTGTFWKRLRAQVEYRQILGIAGYGLQYPYTLRMGVTYEF